VSGRDMRLCISMAIALLAGPRAGAKYTVPQGPFGPAIAEAGERVVKLYGAALGREKAYGSGVLVSSDGQIVTALSLMLEGQALRAVLPDGRSFPAQVERRDAGRQLALLKIGAVNLPYFELADSKQLATGDWLIAAANAFKVADGPEPVSISIGVLSGRTDLSARLRAQDFPYDGPVLLTDMIIATPGSPGGAVVDVQGRLVGLIGRTVISKRTNTWVNYALPVEQVAAFLRGEEYRPRAAGSETASGADRTPLSVGMRLFDIGGRTRPAYVERVRPNSPAVWAGVRPDDLVLSVNGETVATCDELRRAFTSAPPGLPLTLVVKRGEALHVCELVVDSEDK
jgi:S1-C subfamily serine protease